MPPKNSKTSGAPASNVPASATNTTQSMEIDLSTTPAAHPAAAAASSGHSTEQSSTLISSSTSLSGRSNPIAPTKSVAAAAYSSAMDVDPPAKAAPGPKPRGVKRPSAKMQALDRADQASSSSGSFGSGSGPVKIFSFRELQYQAMQAEEMRSQWGITKTAYGMIRFTVEKFFDLPGQEFQRKNRVYYGCAKPRESANSAGGAASFLQSLAKTAVNSSPSKRQALDKGAYAARTETTSNVQRYCGAKTEAKAKPLQMQTTASTAASNDHEVGPGTGSSASASSASGAASSTSAMTPDVYQATFTGFSPSIAPSLDELLAIDPEDPNNWWICKHHHVLDSAIPHMRTTFVLIDQSPSALKQMQMQEAFSSGAAGSSDSDARRGTLSNQKMTVGTENLEDANPHRIRATVFEDAASLIWKKDYPGQAYYDEVEDVADVDNSIKHVDESWIKAVHTTPITMKAKLTIKFKVDRTGNIAPTEIEMLLLNEVRKA